MKNVKGGDNLEKENEIITLRLSAGKEASSADYSIAGLDGGGAMEWKGECCGFGCRFGGSLPGSEVATKSEDMEPGKSSALCERESEEGNPPEEGRGTISVAVMSAADIRGACGRRRGGAHSERYIHMAL